ncbi:SpoIIE family protein phosphatase [Marivirga sp. S37H4]|uniref:SpoIIE family protein phosphatase n=1 Tax=Marivirga aurantiaca TaxID=2802615 RepID=A0A934WWI2_9BACT|nr:SpoIIE family protein phosphatase [Marivirga aurantiaca]MBK6264242.1 SpoIIE family protein phosphatase [Marivirga aurantiaca]
MMKKAYYLYKVEKVLESGKWILGIGILILLYFVFADFKFRHTPHIALTRYTSIVLALAFLLLRKIARPSAKKWVFPLFHAFLFSLVFMQLAVITLDFETEYFHSAISGSIVVVFIIALVMRANTISAFLILVAPFIGFVIFTLIFLNPEGSILIELANPFAMVIAAFVMNQVNESLRYKEFSTNKLLLHEQETTRRLLEQEKQLNDEIMLRNVEVEQKKNELELANKDMQESLDYAQQLQHTMLPANEVIGSVFPEHFLFFKPRDKVSGDFYWAKESKGRLYFAVADATGHGVPAAFLSILGITFLDSILKDSPEASPSEVLQLLRKKVIDNFGIDDDSIKDGIDMALCRWDPLEKTLEYSGAMRPLHLIVNQDIITYKATRCPIGYYPKIMDFENHVIKIEQATNVFLCTDGFADQFNGENDKKYNQRRFKEFILTISEETTENQDLIVHNEFSNWKGSADQIDDVLIMGVKINVSA